MLPEEIKEYYLREDVKRAVLGFCESREVVPVYPGGRFGKRPGAVVYEKDFESLVESGAQTFYGSLERWLNPMSLSKELKPEDLGRLRKGWDFVIDIDCSRELSYAKVAARAVLDILDLYGVSHSIKFSGRRGFHITIPFESFPGEIEGKPASSMFPELPRLLIDYLIDFAKKSLQEKFGEDPYKILTLDRGVVSPRHLIRLPYCLHQKTWLSSVFIRPSDLEDFSPEDARPGSFKAWVPELSPKEGEASELIEAARLWKAGREKEKKAPAQPPRRFHAPGAGAFTKAAPVRMFPPCIRKILSGLSDGRKRSAFLLTTFLYHAGWRRNSVENLLLEWNRRNSPPLPESSVLYTVRSQFSRKGGPQMPPNCSNEAYYADMGLCSPDESCRLVRNPVAYALRKSRPPRGFAGRLARCDACGYVWKIRKRHGVPARCGRCGSRRITILPAPARAPSASPPSQPSQPSQTIQMAGR